MMSIAIVEDDSDFAGALKTHIEKFFASKAETVEVWYGCGESLLEVLKKKNFGIYLFDVEMPAIDGLSLAEKVYSIHPEARVILLTAYERFALRGIQLGVYYYIVKDNYWAELSRILECICREEEENREEYYFILTEVSGYRVLLNHILYLTKEKKYTVFHCLDGVMYRERDSLANVCQRLPQERFVTINRGMIVNMKHIISLERLDITMRDGKILPVSRYEKTRVLDKLADYWGKIG